VRLLVSKWAPHIRPESSPVDRLAKKTADAGRADRLMEFRSACDQTVHFRGWDSTNGSHSEIPGHNRVNHKKYIRDRSPINIGSPT